jgi:lysophospholipase L1-like esterase
MVGAPTCDYRGVSSGMMDLIVKYSLSLIALFVGSLAMLTNAGENILDHPPIKIICIGDSITQGGNINDQEYTYRLPLYRFLKQKGVNADFIGTRTDGLSETFHWPRDFDPDHEGFYGASTEEVSRALKVDLPKLAAPDIALIDLGSNDQGKDVEKAVIKPLVDIVFQLRARNPQVKIIIIQIPGIVSSFGIHYSTWRMARELNLPKSPIITIPLYLGWDTKGDTIDGSHPNIKGQYKMAAAIFSEIETILQTK